MLGWVTAAKLAATAAATRHRKGLATMRRTWSGTWFSTMRTEVRRSREDGFFLVSCKQWVTRCAADVHSEAGRPVWCRRLLCRRLPAAPAPENLSRRGAGAARQRAPVLPRFCATWRIGSQQAAAASEHAERGRPPLWRRASGAQ